MTPDRELDLLQLLMDGSPTLRSDRLCRMTVEVTATTGAGSVLMSSPTSYGSLGVTDTVSSLMEELQFALGEGPCIDAFRDVRPIVEPDLVNSGGRWISFTEPAIEAGIGAVFAFPLCVGAASIGALHMYRDRPGELTTEQHDDARALADIATRAVLAMQAEAPPGELAVGLAGGFELQHVVHQASGMVAVQLGVGVADALVRLQAHAFGNGRPLREVAVDVVGRRLRFSPDGATPSEGSGESER